MGPSAKVQTLLDINNQTNTLVGCEIGSRRSWHESGGKLSSQDSEAKSS
jgi:hypothetical protein